MKTKVRLLPLDDSIKAIILTSKCKEELIKHLPQSLPVKIDFGKEEIGRATDFSLEDGWLVCEIDTKLLKEIEEGKEPHGEN